MSHPTQPPGPDEQPINPALYAKLTTPPPSHNPPPGWQPPPPSWQPPSGWQPAPQRPRSYWKSRRGAATILAGVIGLAIILCGAAGIIGPRSGQTPDDLKVEITGCSMTTGPLSSATVGLQVTNNSSRARTVRVDVEYRDGAGRRIDTDTAVVRDVRPGDTAAHSETTILDGEASGQGACIIRAVR